MTRTTALLGKLPSLLTVLLLTSISVAVNAQTANITSILPYLTSGNSPGHDNNLTIQVTSGYLIVSGQDLANSSGQASISVSPANTGLSVTPTYISSTQINLLYTLAASANGIRYTISVTPTGGQSGSGTILVTNNVPPAPEINPGGITSPITAGTSGYVSIYGAALQNTQNVTRSYLEYSSGSVVPGATWNLTYTSPTQLNIFYSIPSGTPSGPYQVAVTTSTGTAYIPIVIQ